MAFPGTKNFNYYEGDTFEFAIYPKISTGAFFDLTGYSSSFNIASTTGPSPEFSVGGQAIINNTKTKVTCTILPSVGRQLVAGTTYYYDVQVSNGSDKVYTLLKGTISVEADVTGA
jgi:hypothetical protein